MLLVPASLLLNAPFLGDDTIPIEAAPAFINRDCLNFTEELFSFGAVMFDS